MIPRCENRDEWLGPLLYRDLPFTEEAAAEEHVETCASCGAEAADLRRLVEALPAPAPVPAARPRRFRPWLSAAAVLAAACLGFVAGHGTTPAPPKSQPLAPAPVLATRAEPAPMSLFSPAALAFLSKGSGGLPPAAQEELDGRARGDR